MRNGIIRLALLAAIVWFQFAIYPGHTYLHGPTQIYIPAFERLYAPGFLTRDLISTHTDLTLTVFDEVSLFLHRNLHQTWPIALSIQQLLSRSAALAGLYLLALSAGLRGWWPVACASIAGFAEQMPGSAMSPFQLEPDPGSIACGFVLLAAGLFTRGKPLLAGCLAGIALLYDPVIGSTFWLVTLAALFFHRALRPAVRAMLPLLAIFSLLLANFAQLQPANEAHWATWSQVAAATLRTEAFRLPLLSIQRWPTWYVLFHAGAAVALVLALRALKPRLTPEVRWIAAGFLSLGVLAAVLSLLAFNAVHLNALPLLQPNRVLVLPVLLAFLLTVRGAHISRGTQKILLVATPAVLIACGLGPPVERSTPAIEPAADWARANTWGASMFAFPDAGRTITPGYFRARAIRSVWVDWETGAMAATLPGVAEDWKDRWDTVMAGEFDQKKLARVLRTPTDYIVLSRQHALPSAKPVYADGGYLIYDALELKQHH